MLKNMQNKLTNSIINWHNKNSVPCCHINLMPFHKELLTNVTKHAQNRQLSFLTCFIIHVGLECIGETAYA
jgi:hypothetical protein